MPSYPPKLTPTKIELTMSPVYRFLRQETSAGVMMISFMFLALFWANSPFYQSYETFLQIPIGFSFASWSINYSLAHWVNDGLMTIFFFLIGLELKREFLAGELSNREQAILPVVAAFGGMAVPALIYLSINANTLFAKGWAIPTATDIAFAMGALSLLGNRVPTSLKLFLTTLAIADDLGAILIIALFYGGNVQIIPLIGALFTLGLFIIGNRVGVKSLLFYAMLTFILWIFILISGIHATIAGVLAAIFIPFKAYVPEADFVNAAQGSLSKYAKANQLEPPSIPDETTEVIERMVHHRYHSITAPESVEAIQELRSYFAYVESPLKALERILHSWVSFFIIPLFTLCNAGVRLVGTSLSHSYSDSLTIGVILGLVVGKPLGIFSICFIFSKLKIIKISEELSWAHIFGAGTLAGIGFTMSLFVSNLAFADSPTLLNDSKIGILSGSFLSIILGLSILFNTKKKPPKIKIEKNFPLK